MSHSTSTLTQNLAAILLASLTQAVAAHEWSNSRPDGHAPIGVMGDHVHKKGEWMLSYRYMAMTMDGNQDNGDTLSTEQLLEDYSVAPLDMDMQMHMFGAMYAITDRVTLMAMLPLLNKSMTHRTRAGTEFETETAGIGDIKMSALVGLYERGHHKVHLNLGLSLPTGAIDERDNTPMMVNAKLPYPMQLGSGSYDLLPGITYLGQNAERSWGAQALATLRTADNDDDYRLGNGFELSTWYGWMLTDSLSLSARLNYKDWDDISGNDDELNPMMVPTADPNLRAGERLEAGVGFNLYLREGIFSGHRLALEYLAPIEQKLDGPQLETESSLILGWQLAL